MNLPPAYTFNFAGEKTRRLYWCLFNDGLIKVSNDAGRLVWVFTRKPTAPIVDGITIPAERFYKSAVALGYTLDQLFELSDDGFRELARTIAGIHATTSNAASGEPHYEHA